MNRPQRRRTRPAVGEWVGGACSADPEGAIAGDVDAVDEPGRGREGVARLGETEAAVRPELDQVSAVAAAPVPPLDTAAPKSMGVSDWIATTT